jgi:hypothetical protein
MVLGKKAICTICLILVASFSVWAAYAGKGEVRGRVIESHQAESYVAFEMEIESQQVTVRLGSPNSFLFRGTLMKEITPGSNLHLWIDGGADLDCKPCGIFVKKVEFADGRVSKGQPIAIESNGETSKGQPIAVESGAETSKGQPIANERRSRIGSCAALLLAVAAILLVIWFVIVRRRVR